MRERFLGMAVAATLLMGVAAPVHADSDEVLPGMGKKLIRGVADTFTGWVEWPVQIYKGWTRGASFVKNETGSKITGTVIGLIWTGPTHALGRTGSGFRDLFGFWTANPADVVSKGIGTPLDAEYSWEEGTKYDCFDPNVGEGLLKPWGRKIVHGVTNGLGAILELPGQIVKGCKEDKVGTGIVKGIWYPLSRMAYGGFGEVFTFMLPNHHSHPGHAFEEKWPWDALVGNANSAK